MYLFIFGSAEHHVELRTKFPNQGSNLHPLPWKCRVLTTRPQGNHPKYLFLKKKILVIKL